jgi:hypothetical protein
METLKYIITADKTRFMVLLMLKQSGNHDSGNPPTFVFALTEKIMLSNLENESDAYYFIHLQGNCTL